MTDSRQNHSAEDESSHPASKEASFGGCRYRLSYDRYQKDQCPVKTESHPAAGHNGLTIMFLALFLLVFFVVSLLIYRYFMAEVRDRLTVARAYDEKQTDTSYTFMQSGDGHAA